MEEARERERVAQLERISVSFARTSLLGRALNAWRDALARHKERARAERKRNRELLERCLVGWKVYAERRAMKREMDRARKEREESMARTLEKQQRRAKEKETEERRHDDAGSSKRAVWETLKRSAIEIREAEENRAASDALFLADERETRLGEAPNGTMPHSDGALHTQGQDQDHGNRQLHGQDHDLSYLTSARAVQILAEVSLRKLATQLDRDKQKRDHVNRTAAEMSYAGAASTPEEYRHFATFEMIMIIDVIITT